MADRLIEDARHGCERSWERLVEAVTPRLKGAVARYGLTDTTAVIGDVWEAVAAGVDSFDGQSLDHFVRWAVGIACHKAADQARHQQRIYPVGELPQQADDHLPEDRVVEREATGRLIQLAGAVLPAGQQQVVLLELAGYEPGEIADLLGISPGAARKRRQRAHATLRRRLSHT